MNGEPNQSKPEDSDTLAAGKLAPWTVGELPPPPAQGLRRWTSVIGPGILLVGVSIGAGEWLFGPSVTAQYGATLLWLATLSILGQVFCNLEMIRYTLYCGEPIYVGFFRTWPGPKLWTVCYAILDVAHIWPFMASNAAVVLAAVFLGHLPREDDPLAFLGLSLSEGELVRWLGYALFLVAFVPLFFGGTVYQMLLRIMTFKVIIVLGYLIFFAIFTVSWNNQREVLAGFVHVGMVPLRADTIVAGRHFTLKESDGPNSYVLKGTLTDREATVAEFTIRDKDKVEKYKSEKAVPAEYHRKLKELQERAKELAKPGAFFVEDAREGVTLSLTGTIREDGSWQVKEKGITVKDSRGSQSYDLKDVPEPHGRRVRAFLERQGVEEVSLIGYWREHGRLPALPWATLAAFAAIAGTGGLANTLYSSFARDKGWGMGAHVGAIPSLVGGRTITLSHVGQAFRPDPASRPRWRGWMRYIVEDQVVIWALCNFLGMALPCMLALEFLRHAPVSDVAVAAQTAEGMEYRYPNLGWLLWLTTLLVAFLILFPNQIVSADIVARRWTDLIWTASPQAQKMSGHQIKYVYYGILLLYGVWGLVALTYFKPLQIAIISAVLMNVALGFSALHTLYVNRTLLPPQLRPNWFMQAGTAFCGLFFLSISAVVFFAS